MSHNPCVQSFLRAFVLDGARSCALVNAQPLEVLLYKVCCVNQRCALDSRRRTMRSINQRQQREQLGKGKYSAFNRSTHLFGVVRRTYASFVNRSTETLKFIWLDFDGNPQQYHIVRPGRKYHVYTFNTHQWIVEDLLGTVWASHVYGASTSLCCVTQIPADHQAVHWND